MSLDLLRQDAIEAYYSLSSTVSQCTNLIDHVMADWAEEGLYRGTLLVLSDGYTFFTLCVTWHEAKIHL